MVLVDISSSSQNLFPNKKDISFKTVFYVFIGISLPYEPHKHSILANTCYCGLMVAHSKPYQILYRKCIAQAVIPSQEVLVPGVHSLPPVLTTVNSSLWWKMILACYSCMERPMVFVQRSSHKTQPKGVRLAAVQGGSGEGQIVSWAT